MDVARKKLWISRDEFINDYVHQNEPDLVSQLEEKLPLRAERQWFTKMADNIRTRIAHKTTETKEYEGNK